MDPGWSNGHARPLNARMERERGVVRRLRSMEDSTERGTSCTERENDESSCTELNINQKEKE